jgi:hypothetical protein
MPNTLIPIQTYTLSATASSVTFSNIPQNYTDLKLVVSGRTDAAQGVTQLSFNGLTTNLSSRIIYGIGSGTPGSVSYASVIRAGYIVGTDYTASTFANNEIYIPNYTSSSNKSVSIDSVGENNATEVYSSLNAGLWAASAAITSLTLTVLNNSTGAAANFVTNSTFTLYGISNGVKATGGTLTVAGGYAYHTFTSTGSFLPSQKITGAEVLVVAGGGGGARRHGGGGGAGGLSYGTSQSFIAGQSYTALVGAGGAGGATSSSGTTGGNSVIGQVISNGGGAGIGGASKSVAIGGSGGGSADYGTSATVGGTANQGNTGGATGYGNNGGAGKDNGSNSLAAGGGGGSGAVGQNAPSTTQPGNGGIGLSNWSAWHAITGTGVLSSGLYYIAAGGGGSSFNQSGFGTGGIGGGGAGSSTGAATSGTANTGSGGGGQGDDNNASGSGGSGLVIVRYPLS